MARVVLENLSKIFKGPKNQPTVAVHRLDLAIAEGEFLVLVGPSGCGKSTTLRMVAGLEDPTTGKIMINERIVNDVPPKDRDVAMVFQNYALYPHMTVYENLAFGLKLRKVPRAEVDQRVRETAGVLGLDRLLPQKPKALSGGQRQRVALGRAMVRNPKVFLFDEPLSNLDAQMRLQMRTEIARLLDRLQTTAIYVTHDQTEAMTMGDRIVVMKDGQIQQVDAPLPLYQNPANLFVASFIGSPSMNFLTVNVQNDQNGLVLTEVTPADSAVSDALLVTLPAPIADCIKGRVGQKLILGVRPEDVEATAAAASTGRGGRARVELVEPLGPETLLHLKTAGHTILARVKPDCPLQLRDEVRLNFTMAKVHFFDPATEQRL